MNRTKATFASFGLLATALAVFVACNSITGLNGNPTGGTNNEVLPASEGRQNAALMIDNGPGKLVFVDLLQYDPADLLQQRCAPLGAPGVNPWRSRFGGPIVLNLFKNNVIGSSIQGIASEYDELVNIGETGFCLGVRSPAASVIDPNFSHVEFNIRAVNPFAFGHAPGFDYVNTVDGNQAFYPSNDENPGPVPGFPDNRSLINVAGGDVAIAIRGLDFFGIGAKQTFATMNFLGPTGWVLFFRDNAFQSGRFYNLQGARKGAPRAFEDTPPSGDEGFFESAQVNGDNFDANSTNAVTFPPPAFFFGACPGPAHPADYPKAYSFADWSNINEAGAPAVGQGGFVLVIRRQAFFGKGVVVNPNVPGPASAPIDPLNDTITPPGSGYNEPAIPAITGPDEDALLPTTPGVHEIGFSVFFIHSAAP